MVKLIFLFLATTGLLFADEMPVEAPPEVTLDSLKSDIATLRSETDWVWTCIAAFLVFFMQAGFAFVEAGFTRAKNTVNILMKNFADMSFGAMAFWLVGFSLMFGEAVFKDFGLGQWSLAENLLNSDKGEMEAGNYTFFIFQIVFAATAATIVSGTMAERTKFHTYLLFSIVITAVIYPIFGSFAWAGLFGKSSGFLENLQIGSSEGVEGRNFLDFAGSTVVHSVGAWAGLAGALIVGPRVGKFQEDGRIYPLLGHNMSMAALGVFILWFGWFGFNPGSTTSVGEGSFARIAVMTHMAACAGAMGSMIVTWILFKKPEIGLSLNGALAGLVAITAPCDNVSITGAVAIGFVAGVLVVFSVLFFDKIKIDDPVGAISVHGVCGAWGTLSVGLFNLDTGYLYGGGTYQLIAQGIGIATAFVWTFTTSLLVFLILKYTVGIRVSMDEEIIGLDILEHGNEAYPVSK